MNYIVISDIFGNKLPKDLDANNRLPFILIHTTQPYLLLNQVTNISKYDNIWTLLGERILHALYMHSINPRQFAPLGDIWFPSKTLPKEMKIILANISSPLSAYPVDYVKLDNYHDTFIWNPIPPAGYKAVGLVASVDKPSTRKIKVINEKYLVNYNKQTQMVGKNTSMNEFNLLSHIGINKYTINRTMFLTNPSVITIASNKNAEYLSTDDTNSLFTNSSKDNNSRISYTIQGELKMNDKCIGVDNVDGKSINLQKCNNQLNQKWYPYRNKYISLDQHKCLTSSDDGLSVTDCQDNISQKWFTNDYNEVIYQTNQESVDHWKTESGKNVILVEPDNPWYITKRKNTIEGIIRQDVTPLNQVDYKNADFPSSFMMDVYRPDLGFGHSYAERKGRRVLCIDDCKNAYLNNLILENFDGEKSSKESYKLDFAVIACILILLIFLLVIIRFYINNKN